MLLLAKLGELNDSLVFTESTLFGVPLATLLETDQKTKPHASTPLVLQAVRTQNTSVLHKQKSPFFYHTII